ncbi:MAG: MBL fold metallo-hydrolase [Roseburia sp.]|nr:MBL fold metallo-hydrolase [Anaeroplasma bactoclasticum]MCM1195643.1 MBL fold metallo-hydrolase [Roseburia sp.]MCM1556612.1 MBL fold metallo-hydrolase [Anaeroplasma bactoclasticum]
MRIEVFASGSTGNCTYIETKNHKILIDTGISKRCIDTELEKLGVNFSQIDTLFITHEHEDHIRSLCTTLKKGNLICYMTKGTYQAILNGKNEALKKVLQERLIDGHIILLNRMANSIRYDIIFLDTIEVEVLPTFHDAAESVGYKIKEGNQTIVYITDTGYVHHCLFETISNADCYVLEFNHDPYILMSSDRSYSLKQRILSDHGHLSNEDAAVTLAKIMGDKTKLVFYAHISQECNLSEIIELTRKKVMSDLGMDTSKVEFVLTSPFPTKVYSI